MDPSGIDKDRLIAKNRYECEMISIISGQLEDVYIYIREGGREESDEKKDRKSKYDQSSDTAISRASITLLIQFVVYKRVN